MSTVLPTSINGYRLNKFIIKAEIPEGTLLLNTTTGGIVAIEKGEDIGKLLNELKKMYFYVPLDFNEVEWVENLRAKAKTKCSKLDVHSFTIFTTTACNAQCFYCFEKGQAKRTMDANTAIKVADYIVNSSSRKTRHIRWFGGEPLVNTSAIDLICEVLTNKGISYKSSMISNGLLFSDSIISKAKEFWNLERVQITLDGTKDIYQKVKAYKNSKGNEFEKVIEKIHNLLKAEIFVSVRLNQDLYNTEDLLDLVDFLSSKFKGNKRLSVYNYWIYDNDNSSDSKQEIQKYENFKKLQQKIISSGLFRNKNLKKNPLRLSHCMADNDSSLVLTPIGEIGKCEHFSDQFLIGNIHCVQINDTEVEKWKEKYPKQQKCFDCPLYPQCIRLKRCPAERQECTLTECDNKIELIRMALIQKYQTSKEGSSA